jgi:hypothetical protein
LRTFVLLALPVPLRTTAMPTSFEEIEFLKREYTDRMVRIASDRPALARFRGLTGRIVTINMNGRALVEWNDFANDIGWHDIRLEDLQVE